MSSGEFWESQIGHLHWQLGLELWLAARVASLLSAFAAPRLSLAMALCLPIALGCGPEELVLRGGFLSHPVIVNNVKFIGEKPFLRLWKGHPAMCKFFTGRPTCKRPLANSSVFESLQKVRNLKFQELVRIARDSNTEQAPIEPFDLADQLGLDAEAPKASPTKSRRAVSALRLLPQLPAFAAVSYEHPPDGWEPLLLMEAASKAPAIEATPENLQMLFNLINAELSAGTTKRARHGSEASGSRPAPRGHPGARQYFVRNRWATKIPEPIVDGAARPPYTKRFRTLKRRSSDEVVASKPKTKQNRKSGARVSPSVLAAAAQADDCLSMM